MVRPRTEPTGGTQTFTGPHPCRDRMEGLKGKGVTWRVIKYRDRTPPDDPKSNLRQKYKTRS